MIQFIYYRYLYGYISRAKEIYQRFQYKLKKTTTKNY